MLLVITMWIVTICTYASYVPQIIKMMKTKRSEDLSISAWSMWLLSATCNTLYSFLLCRNELIIASVSELVLTLITIVFVIKYKDTDKNAKQEVQKEIKVIGRYIMVQRLVTCIGSRDLPEDNYLV